MADQRQGGIAWTEETWNPTRGCSLVSSGCTNCYAMRQAARMDHPGGAYEGLTRSTARGQVWSGAVRLVPEVLDRPLRWTRPRMVFVNSMSDLFHESLSNEQIAAVFGVMALAHQHTFQVLTKRAARMLEWLCEYAAGGRHVWAAAQRMKMPRGQEKPSPGWPLPNVWLGVSCEDQPAWDSRVPLLLQCPAAVRWVSAEPLLGPIDVERVGEQKLASGELNQVWYPLRGQFGFWSDRWHVNPCGCLDWIVVGGESGPNARPCDVQWVRSIVRECRNASVPCFVKQLGAHYVDAENGVGGVQARPDQTLVPPIRRLVDPKGGDSSEWPQDLRVREWPLMPADWDNPLGAVGYDEDAFGRPVYDPPDEP